MRMVSLALAVMLLSVSLFSPTVDAAENMTPRGQLYINAKDTTVFGEDSPFYTTGWFVLPNLTPTVPEDGLSVVYAGIGFGPLVKHGAWEHSLAFELYAAGYMGTDFFDPAVSMWMDYRNKYITFLLLTDILIYDPDDTYYWGMGLTNTYPLAAGFVTEIGMTGPAIAYLIGDVVEFDLAWMVEHDHIDDDPTKGRYTWPTLMTTLRF